CHTRPHYFPTRRSSDLTPSKINSERNRTAFRNNTARVSHPAQHPPGVGGLHARDLLGRAGGDDFAAAIAALRPQIDDPVGVADRSEEHTSELQSRVDLV